MLLRKNTEDLFSVASSRVKNSADKSTTNDHNTNIKDDKKIIEDNENVVGLVKELNPNSTGPHTDHTGQIDRNDAVQDTATTEGHHHISTNTDLATALKEVLSITVPDFSSSKPGDQEQTKFSSEDQLEIIGQKTRDQLNKMYRTSLLDKARHYALTIGMCVYVCACVCMCVHACVCVCMTTFVVCMQSMCDILNISSGHSYFLP